MSALNSITISGIVTPGHQVASGQAIDSPYERGTLEMQRPYFRELGLDLGDFYLGTLNVSIAPHTFELTAPQYTFERVKWHPDYPAETFSFSPVVVNWQDSNYRGLIYYPHPATKIGHFQDPAIIEIIAPKLANCSYGDRLSLKLNSQEIQLTTRK